MRSGALNLLFLCTRFSRRYLDREVAGLPALSFLSSSHLPQPPDSQRTLVFGGKGGVGKTTCAAATAVGLASQGLSVAVISTDPAHSLGDALGSDLSSSPDGVDLTPLLPSPPAGASLRAFEVDPASAIEDLTAALSSLSPPPALSDAGLSPADLGSLLSTLPPGADEVVALGSLVGILERGGYDRVVIDTAPTGHALRLLS
jgi:arsenite-transporting ATPase